MLLLFLSCFREALPALCLVPVCTHCKLLSGSFSWQTCMHACLRKSAKHFVGPPHIPRASPCTAMAPPVSPLSALPPLSRNLPPPLSCCTAISTVSHPSPRSLSLPHVHDLHSLSCQSSTIDRSITATPRAGRRSVSAGVDPLFGGDHVIALGDNNQHDPDLPHPGSPPLVRLQAGVPADECDDRSVVLTASTGRLNQAATSTPSSYPSGTPGILVSIPPPGIAVTVVLQYTLEAFVHCSESAGKVRQEHGTGNQYTGIISMHEWPAFGFLNQAPTTAKLSATTISQLMQG